MRRRSLLIPFTLVLHIITGCAATSVPETPRSQTLSGDAIVGTTLTAPDENGHALTLQIVDVKRDPQDAEIYRYTVLSRNPHTHAWQNLCPRDRSGAAEAIPLSGQWDSTGAHIENNQITFACTNSVLAKCVQLGYKLWATINGQSLRPYHQACTRMLRADYCGNGIAHTREGTPIDIYDRLDIQQPTANNSMTFEAAWSPEGAVALSRTRYPHTFQQLQQECPQRLQVIVKQQMPSDALLFNHSSVQPES